MIWKPGASASHPGSSTARLEHKTARQTVLEKSRGNCQSCSVPDVRYGELYGKRAGGVDPCAFMCWTTPRAIKKTKGNPNTRLQRLGRLDAQNCGQARQSNFVRCITRVGGAAQVAGPLVQPRVGNRQREETSMSRWYSCRHDAPRQCLCNRLDVIYALPEGDARR